MDAPPDVSSQQLEQDVQHLRLLAIFHYIWGGLIALGGCASLIYIVLGLVFIAAPPPEIEAEDVPAGLIGGLMIGAGGCMMLVLFGLGALHIAAGYFLQQQRNRIFCMVMAAIACLSIPLGTVLGVFTLIILSRPSVVALIDRAGRPT